MGLRLRPECVAFAAAAAVSLLIPLACAVDDAASDSVATDIVESTESSTSTSVPKTLTIAGTVTGLAAVGLQLSNSGTDTLAITTNGSFSFPTRLPSGTPYAVTVATQPTTQTCIVTNGIGTVGTSDITTVMVTCKTKPSLSIGGTVTGLAGSGLQLSNNVTDLLAITANGAFVFPTRLPSGTPYAVSVVAQPTSQTCVVTDGTGTVGTSDITTVVVTCKAKPLLSVGGTVSGLNGPGLLLSLNGTDTLAIASNGVFIFPTRLPSGSPYSVTVVAQPASQQTCVVSSSSGTIGSSNVINVSVICSV